MEVSSKLGYRMLAPLRECDKRKCKMSVCFVDWLSVLEMKCKLSKKVLPSLGYECSNVAMLLRIELFDKSV